MRENPIKQIDIDKAIWVITRKTLYHEIIYGNTIFRIDVYCDGKFVETIHRKFCRMSRQWAVKFETRMHRIFIKNERLAIDIDDEYAFKYSSSGSFPCLKS